MLLRLFIAAAGGAVFCALAWIAVSRRIGV